MRAALAFGLIGLVIFVQYPAGGVPFLLLAAVLGWRARERIQLTFSGLTQKAQSRTSDLPKWGPVQLAPLTPLRVVRFLLMPLVLIAVVLCLSVLFDVFSSAVRHAKVNWHYSGIGMLMSTALGWAAWSLWRFREVLSAGDLLHQLVDGALRFVAAGLGAFTIIWSLSWLPLTVSDNWSIDMIVVACFAFPALVFAAMAGLGFAHRDWFLTFIPSRPVLRVALWACALAGAISAVLILVAVYIRLTGKEHNLSITAWAWGLACGMVAAAALSNALSVHAGARRFGAGYGGALLMSLGALIPALWIEAFTSGRNLIESWNVLIFLMPFVFLVSVAVGLLLMVSGGYLYRKAF